MSKLFLKTANGLISVIVVLFMILAGLYSAYALWDNYRVYEAAEEVQLDLQKFKPKVTEGQAESVSFEDMLAINPDVCAWVTLDNTHIDYPILQGESNLTYINTDVYGNFALAGSIYLDSRNRRDFADDYSLLYGHHMDRGRMFGDLDLYKKEDFFNDNRTGTLITPDGVYSLDVLAVVVVSSSDRVYFDLHNWEYNNHGLIDYTVENALFARTEELKDLREQTHGKILAFSTCSSDFTEARTVVLTAVHSGS